MVRHTSGLLCASLPADRADRLDLAPMVTSTSDGPICAVAVDARHDVSTGIAAADRARTATVLADPDAGPADLTARATYSPCARVLAEYWSMPTRPRPRLTSADSADSPVSP
jgi:hypothetical protein